MLNVNVTSAVVRTMSTIRLYNPTPLQAGQRYVLDDAQSRYLSRALRLRAGDVITLFDGSGGEYPATIVTESRQKVEIETGEHRALECESSLLVHLVQGMSKGDRFDTVVQKATELGVQKITPVITDFTLVRLDHKRLVKKQEHWQRIARSACEQCGRNRVPTVEMPLSLLAWFGANAGVLECAVILNPRATEPLAAAKVTDAVTILIGPEGGFSDAEYARAEIAGLQAVSLGPRVLRTETAAIAAIGVAQGLWGDLRT